MKMGCYLHLKFVAQLEVNFLIKRYQKQANMKYYLFALLFGLLVFQSSPTSFLNYTEELDNLSIEMVAIPGGTFQMGNEDSTNAKANELPLHEVQIDSFWLAKYEVTWDLYEKWLNRDKSNETFSDQTNKLAIEVDAISGASTPYIDMSFGMGKEGYPATSMTQYGGLTFCKWLSAKTGHFYRLPTEAEWEYACKKGLDTIELTEKAWYRDNSDEAYHKVGEKPANALGIHDMLGNVAEWTMDQYIEDFYQKSPKNAPWAYPTELYPRIVRGGSWKDKTNRCNCTYRRKSHPNWKQIDPQLPKSRWWHTSAPFVGIRLVRPYKTPSPEEIKKYWLPPIDDY